MPHPIYQIDAFTDQLFGGNPAAVVPLAEWLPDDILQNIATENNLSETAFFIAKNDDYHLRWFTPANEVKLCGHATLAAAFVIFNFLKPELTALRFDSLSGPLMVTRDGDLLTLDLPAWTHTKADAPKALVAALGTQILEYYHGDYEMAVVADEAAVRAVAPDMRALKAVLPTGIIITAQGDRYDFVSRSFFPDWGVDEDPVTGSSHCMLTPYWAKRLGKASLSARQISARGGDVACRIEGDRVFLSGKAVLYLKGELAL